MVPVPMTMQTLAILLIGIACGARLASETVGLYLVQGAVGLPVFAGGAAGVQHLWGPTGGYLVGFLFAAALIGLLADRGWSNGIIKPLCALAIGHIAVFIPGTLWLAGFTGFEGAIAAGLTPFIPGTIVKTLLAFALFKGLVTWIYPKAATPNIDSPATAWRSACPCAGTKRPAAYRACPGVLSTPWRTACLPKRASPL